LKAAVQNLKPLQHPDLNKPFYVEADASEHTLGAVLMHQRDWSIGEKETFAIIYSIEKWEKLLNPHHFVVYTDHKPSNYYLIMLDCFEEISFGDGH